MRWRLGITSFQGRLRRAGEADAQDFEAAVVPQQGEMADDLCFEFFPMIGSSRSWKAAVRDKVFVL